MNKVRDVWQTLHPAGKFGDERPHRNVYPASLDDGRQILLPIRPLAGGRHALASLIINQASFAVQDALADSLVRKLAAFEPELVVGLPTLGLTLAEGVARRLNHGRYAPLGTSRKFWYRDELSVPISSVTTPDAPKRLYVDPRLPDMLAGRRVALVDDVISSGTSILAALRLMAVIGIEPVAIGAAMLQSERWHNPLLTYGPQWPSRVRGVFRTPLLKTDGEEGWV